MQNFGRAARRTGAIAGVAALGLLASSVSVSAQTQDRPAAFAGNTIPQDILDHWSDCPRPDAFPAEAGVAVCLKVRAYDGELQIGKIRATIDDPIELTVGVGLMEDGPDADTEADLAIVPGLGGNAAPAPVRISGGILGIPALDPILDNSLGLLSLTATPELGSVGASTYGASIVELDAISLPLSIKLNNALFGPNCRIGTPADPIDIELTTTAPGGRLPDLQPYQAWSGYGREHVGEFDDRYFIGGGSVQTHEALAARQVDTTFSVPAAVNCDPLPRSLHQALDPVTRQVDSLLGRLGLPKVANRLLGNTGGLFNPVIDSVAGLPSPSGRNRMALSVDVESMTYEMMDVIDGHATQLIDIDGAHNDFGNVTVGTSADRTITVTNNGPNAAPFDFFAIATATLRDRGSIGIVNDGCEGSVLDPGEACSFTVRWTPTEAGFNSGLATEAFVFPAPKGTVFTTWEGNAVSP